MQNLGGQTKSIMVFSEMAYMRYLPFLVLYLVWPRSNKNVHRFFSVYKYIELGSNSLSVLH